MKSYVMVKDLKKGDFFKLKPEGNVVYVRGDYCRSEKRYECNKFYDFCDFRYFKGEKKVFIDFIF